MSVFATPESAKRLSDRMVRASPRLQKDVDANEEAELRRLEGRPTSGAAAVGACDADMLPVAVAVGREGDKDDREDAEMQLTASVEGLL